MKDMDSRLRGNDAWALQGMKGLKGMKGLIGMDSRLRGNDAWAWRSGLVRVFVFRKKTHQRLIQFIDKTGVAHIRRVIPAKAGIHALLP